MRVTGLRTVGFRNLASGPVALGRGTTLAWGPNGAGKTNLLEALYFGLTGRSCRTARARETLAFGAPLARVEVEVADGGERRRFLCSLARDGERRHLVDGAPVERRHAELRPPVAVFLPDRLVVVKGPPAVRRAHLDRFWGARWPSRTALRQRYSETLSQRNALLGQIRAGRSHADALDAWDRELALAGSELAAVRAEAAALLAPRFATIASELGLPGAATLAYRTGGDLTDAEPLLAELHRRRQADLARGFTGYGPHLDELDLSLDGRSLRRYASQGQQRAAVLALLFAERGVLVDAGRPAPLMLLDDVMSELDGGRRHALGEWLRHGEGQALITATDPAELPGELDRTEVAVREGRLITAVDGPTPKAVPPAGAEAA